MNWFDYAQTKYTHTHTHTVSFQLRIQKAVCEHHSQLNSEKKIDNLQTSNFSGAEHVRQTNEQKVPKSTKPFLGEAKHINCFSSDRVRNSQHTSKEGEIIWYC